MSFVYFLLLFASVSHVKCNSHSECVMGLFTQIGRKYIRLHDFPLMQMQRSMVGSLFCRALKYSFHHMMGGGQCVGLFNSLVC